MHQRYPVEVKDSVVAKVLSRGDRTIEDVCRQEGISPQTVANWLRKHAKVSGMKKSNDIKKWSAEEKLKALFDTRSLAENDFGTYLRKEGLYSHQVTEWRADALKSLDEARTRPQAPKRDERDDRIKELEYDLARMEKALAEASARMVLQKKADLFWAERELRMKK
jgi:transposase-like protein